MAHNQKIYFVCPTNKRPAGGVKQMYRMVDVLNENGYDAYIVHKKKHRETWFQNETRIKVNPYIFKKIKFLLKGKTSFVGNLQLELLKKLSFRVESEAVLVYPEIFGAGIHRILPNKFAVFNQNCYYTFQNYGLDLRENSCAYLSSNNLGTIAVSEDSAEYIRYAFPGHSVWRIYLGIDTNIFRYSSKKKLQIAFMPRKLPEDISQVINILKARGNLKNWGLVPIDGKGESEVAKIFQESAVFLSFNDREGFGLPPVEAMLCGCYVIGYKGQAGKEYFNPKFSSAVPDGDIISFVKAVEEIVYLYEENPELIKNKTKLAEEFIKNKYNMRNEAASITNVWREILH